MRDNTALSTQDTRPRTHSLMCSTVACRGRDGAPRSQPRPTGGHLVPGSPGKLLPLAFPLPQHQQQSQCPSQSIAYHRTRESLQPKCFFWRASLGESFTISFPLGVSESRYREGDFPKETEQLCGWARSRDFGLSSAPWTAAQYQPNISDGTVTVGGMGTQGAVTLCALWA